MSLRNRLVLPIILSTLAVLAGCGGSNTATAPPSGGYADSNLNGSYAFSAIGTDSGGAPFSLAGSFAASGTGTVASGGALDLNDPAIGVFPGLAITGGSYNVTKDGRGKASLNTSQGTIVLDFVLLSNSHALVTRYDGNGTGSGSMDVQSTITQAQIAGSYAFTLGGVDTGYFPFATIGSFTLDSSGNIVSGTGVQDSNDQGFAYPGQALTGSVILGTGSAPGTATFNTTTFGTLTFDVYAVDATHLKFVETDAAPILSGDVYTQQGASLPTTSTVLVYTMAGGVTAPVSTAGLINIDGAGTITSGLEDINANGTVATAPLNFTGGYVGGGTGGRTVLNVSAFSGATQFAAYPTTNAGLLMLESDNAGLLDGAALVQTAGAALASGQGYGLNVSAVNIGGVSAFEEDDIAEFTTTSTGLSGLIDINDEGSLSFDQTFTGGYSLDTSGDGRGVLTSNLVNGVFYAVDGSTLLFLETDSNQVGTGAFLVQTSSGNSRVAAARVPLVRVTAAARAALKKKVGK